MYELILITCGTSLLTGGQLPGDLRTCLGEHANANRWENIPEDSRGLLQAHADRRRAELLTADQETARRMSAELNGLLAWHQRRPRKYYDRPHLLVATDTALGQHAAESVRLWLDQQGHQTEILSKPDLATSSLDGFRRALADLAADLHQRLSGYREGGYQIVFNLTGGFKSINGFLQAAATLYADTSFYLFESSRELMLVPRLPLKLDALGIITQHLAAFRRLSLGLPVDLADREGLPELLLFDVDAPGAVLSEWGTLLWQNAKPTLYRERVWPTISARVIGQASFESSLKNASHALVPLINDRLDDLARYIESDKKNNPRSLDAKPVKGQQHQPHWECDLDDNTRIFFVPEGRNLKLVKVAPALHKDRASI